MHGCRRARLSLLPMLAALRPVSYDDDDVPPRKLRRMLPTPHKGSRVRQDDLEDAPHAVGTAVTLNVSVVRSVSTPMSAADCVW